MQWCHGFCDDLVAGDKPRLRSPTYRLASDPPLKRGWRRSSGMQTTPRVVTIEEELFVDDGSVPNNPWLPLIVYRGALQTGPGAAEACIALFERNGWGGVWRNGIYAHHHYQHRARGARCRLGLGPRPARWRRRQDRSAAGRGCRRGPRGRRAQERGSEPGSGRRRRLSAGAGPGYAHAGRTGSRTRWHGSLRFRCPDAIRSTASTDRCSTAGAAPNPAEAASGTG